MPCPECNKVMCDHSPDDRGQRPREIDREYLRDLGLRKLGHRVLPA